MNSIFEPKLDIPVGRYAPDSYTFKADAPPPDNFIVSRCRDGATASVFGDLAWNFSAYTPMGRRGWLYFNFWGDAPATEFQNLLSQTTRRALFSLVWYRNGPPLSIGTLGNYLIVLNSVAKYAELKQGDIGEVLSNDKALIEYVTMECSGWMAETLTSLLKLLGQVGHQYLGFAVVSDKMIQSLRQRNKVYRAGIKQHSPIPTRIYSHLLSSLQSELAEWQLVAADMLAIAAECGANPQYGRTIDQQRVIAQNLGISNVRLPEFEEAASSECLKYFQKKGKPFNVKSLSFLITEFQQTAKLLIQAFTGMRDEEAGCLPYHCLDTTVSNGKTHYIVKGFTSKLNHGLPKRVQWVTNQAGAQAILAAQAIANVIYKIYNVDVPLETTGQINNHPLFVSAGYLNLSTSIQAPVNGRLLPGQLSNCASKVLWSVLFTTIEEEDLRELEQIDPHRAWRAEDKFKIGQQWHFTSHQLRRSLALYAQRSGLVSLPSLRRQLQHLTEEMSRYYAKGSAYAKNFIGDNKDHFGFEWQTTQPESAAISYILNVLLSNDTLFGGHANWVKHRLKSPDGIILLDREQTMNRFKKGEMAFRETLVGGCTNIEECDQVALKYLDIECLSTGCKNMVCNLAKLDRVIAAQMRLIDSIDQESIEYRTEKSDLDVLITAREKALKSKGETI